MRNESTVGISVGGGECQGIATMSGREHSLGIRRYREFGHADGLSLNGKPQATVAHYANACRLPLNEIMLRVSLTTSALGSVRRGKPDADD